MCPYIGMRTDVLTEHPLREARQARGLGLRQLAVKAQVDPSYLSRIERGKQDPSVAVLKRLAKALGLAELVHHLSPYGSNHREAS